jgi:6-pyruvoyltetrahydropterin/6-carboxytetrahydropterin synthase
MVQLTRSFEFSAAHRLYCANLSDEENHRLFGKCSNPHGHGHNYVVEVTVGGTPDAVSGTIVDMPAFDRTVQETVIVPFDHKNLNVECPEFSDLNPSVENIARVIFQRLESALDRGTLLNIRVWETPKTYADYRPSDT